MTVFNEEFHAGGYVVSEGPGSYSRDEVVITGAAALLAGTILGKITLGAKTVGAATAFAGNATNATVSAPTAAAGTPAGDYKVLGITAGATGGFEVYKPDGTLDGEGHVGTAYAGTVGFTITDGSTHLAVGDGWTIPVSYAVGSASYVAHDPANTDGSGVAAAILLADADATIADVAATAHTRKMEYNAAEVIWMTAISDDDKAAGIAALAAQGMIGR